MFTIQSYDPTTGEFGVFPDPSGQGITSDDQLVVDFQPDILDTDKIGDSFLVNWVFPTSSISPQASIGRRIIHWADPNSPIAQIYTVTDNDATSWTVDTSAGPVDPPFNAASRFLVVDDWFAQGDSTRIVESSNVDDLIINVPISGLSNRVVIAGLFMLDSNGNESSELTAPMRDLVIVGDTGGGEKITIALPDDTVGTDVVPQHGHIVSAGAPFLASISAKDPTAMTGRTVIDILYSRDQTTTWVSIFPDGNDSKLILDQGFVGMKFITGFLPDKSFKVGDLIRVDVLEGGGAIGIEMVLQYGGQLPLNFKKPSGTTTQQTIGSTPPTNNKFNLLSGLDSPTSNLFNLVDGSGFPSTYPFNIKVTSATDPTYFENMVVTGFTLFYKVLSHTKSFAPGAIITLA